jgi:hypothetical protein
MSTIRLMRTIRDRSRTAVVLAMVPLVVFNGRTMVGCGCSGHFEAVCQCHGGNITGSCCSAGSVPSRCANKVSRDRCQDSPRAPERVQGHHCTRVAIYVVVQATSTPDALSAKVHDTPFVMAPIDLPIMAGWSITGHDLCPSFGPPPDDLIVTLHRLVI